MGIAFWIIRSCAAAIAGLFCSTSILWAKDIVATAADAGQFTIFLKAAEATGMAKTLHGPGPFTVFAPTDAAFQALPPGTLDRLMKPENKQELAMTLGREGDRGWDQEGRCIDRHQCSAHT